MRCKFIGLLLMGSLAATPLLAGEDDIRAAFGALQKAIKARNPEKIWDLIDTNTQADADRAAKAVQKAYAKKSDKEKPAFEKEYGLSAKELGAMTGKLFLKSNRFHGKYYEVPDGKIEMITVKGDTGRVNFIEEDGDKVKFDLTKQNGKWTFILPMPKAVK